MGQGALRLVGPVRMIALAKGRPVASSFQKALTRLEQQGD